MKTLPSASRQLCLSMFLLIAAACVPAIAQDSMSGSSAEAGGRGYLLPLPEVDPDPAIPDSRTVLRYGWGEEISSHLQIERMLAALAAAAPDRARLVQYGETSEGRSLNYLVISSPDNIARLDGIRETMQRLADPRTLEPGEAERLVTETPAVIWLAYAVHGNEISPSDAALLTAWHLLADRRDVTQELLRKLVVIIDPLQNPDGRDRFVNVFRETRGLFSQNHPRSNEHTERWPGGRYNHYWFDMNRDWFRHSQRETRAKVAAFLEWYPQIYVDSHEMGANSTYYFPPPADPKNPYLLPGQLDWMERLGKHQAGQFDRYGFGYVTREIFDAFYPGYGSEWPTLQGGIGVLWEQASARGLVVRREDETQLTYEDGVRHNYVSGLATLEFAAAHASELLSAFCTARRRNVELGTEGPVQHYFLMNDDPLRAAELARMLVRNGIEVRRLEESLRVEGELVNNGEPGSWTVPKGCFHIPVAQPASRLLRALMDRQVSMDERFLRRQIERNELRLEDQIYDVTAWSLPLASGVPCIQAGALQPASTRWTGEESATAALPDASVAWLLSNSDGGMRALARLLQQGVRVHVNDEPFETGGREFGRGTLIIKRAGNPPDVADRLRKAVEQTGVEVVGLDSAWVDRGAHMGGPDVRWVRPPRILLVVGEPASEACGHTWHLFDEVLQYPTTRVKGEDFQSVRLDEFDVVLLPDGNYGSASGFGRDCADSLRGWMERGGTLVAVRGATRWAADPEIGLLKNQVLRRKVEHPRERDDGDKLAKVAPDNIPGAFFRARVFDRHWVAFGCPAEMDVFYTGRLILNPTGETEGRSLVTFAGEDRLLASGFCWPASLKLLAETPYAVYREVGDGHLVAFTDDPNFRAMYPGLQRFFINAVFFGPGH